MPRKNKTIETNPSTSSIPLDRPPSDMFAVDYEPTEYDICSGRGKKHWNSPGNVAFRAYMQNQVQDYIDATTKTEKSQVVDQIVVNLRKQGCQFLKQNKEKRWFDIGDQGAREKIGHNLRDQVTALKKDKKLEQEKPSHRRTDSSNEADLRRSLLDSTQTLTQFARRPSWVASERMDAEADELQALQDEYLDTFDDSVIQFTAPTTSASEQYQTQSVFVSPTTPTANPVSMDHPPPTLLQSTNSWQDTSHSYLHEGVRATREGSDSNLRQSNLLRGSLMSIGSWGSGSDYNHTNSKNMPRTHGRSSIRVASNGRSPLLESIHSSIFSDDARRSSTSRSREQANLRISDISMHSEMFDELIMGEIR